MNGSDQLISMCIEIILLKRDHGNDDSVKLGQTLSYHIRPLLYFCDSLN